MKEKIVEILQNEYDALDLFSISDKMGISSSEDLERLQMPFCYKMMTISLFPKGILAFL